MGWTTRWLAAVVALAVPAAAGAAVVQTTDRWTMLEGNFAGETLLLETRYPVPDPASPYLQETAFAEVTFLGLTAVTDAALAINTEPTYYEGVEIYADFEFDPAANPAGLNFIAMDPAGGVIDFFPNGLDDWSIDPGFGPGRHWNATRERSIAVIPLPASGALLLGSVATALALSATARRRGSVETAGA
jgi:hypothetical protein